MTERLGRQRHRAFLFFVTSILLLAGSEPAAAADRDVYEVRGVSVDATAETATAAREQALADGERQAIRRLLARMTLRDDHGYLPQLGRTEIAELLQDFSVAEEKTSAVRYLATLNYRFRAEAVRDLLTDYGLPFAETESKPVLVLPVLQQAGAQLLWDEPNSWRAAWLSRSTTDSLVPMVQPLGDLSDIATIGAEQALAGDTRRLMTIGDRYGVGAVLVAQATLARDRASGTISVETYATRHGRAGPEHTLVDRFDGEPGAEEAVVLRQAAEAVAQRVEEEWKLDNLLEFGVVMITPATLPISGLEEWVSIRRRLEGVAVIRRVDVVLLSRTLARLNLHHIGEPDQLALALAQADLALSHDGYDWRIELADRPAAAPR